MSEGNEAEAAAARLEMALERIAALAGRPVQGGATAVDAASFDVVALSGRLDTLIADLRGALAG